MPDERVSLVVVEGQGRGGQRGGAVPRICFDFRGFYLWVVWCGAREWVHLGIYVNLYFRRVPILSSMELRCKVTMG